MSSHTKQDFRSTEIIECDDDVYSSKNVKKNEKKNRLWTKKIVRNQWKRAFDAQSASFINQQLVLQSVSQSAISASIRRLVCVIRLSLNSQFFENSNNFVSASDRFTAECSSHLTSHFRRTVSIISSALTDNRWASTFRKNRQNRQCIRRSQHRMQNLDIIANDVAVS